MVFVSYIVKLIMLAKIVERFEVQKCIGKEML